MDSSLLVYTYYTIIALSGGGFFGWKNCVYPWAEHIYWEMERGALYSSEANESHVHINSSHYHVPSQLGYDMVEISNRWNRLQCQEFN